MALSKEQEECRDALEVVPEEPREEVRRRLENDV